MNKLKPLVPITLDKLRHLKFDLNAMIAYEEAMGESLSQLSSTLSAKQLRALLWAGLIHEDKDLSLAQVGAWVTTDNIAEVTNALNNAIQLSRDDVKEGEVENRDPLSYPPIG